MNQQEFAEKAFQLALTAAELASQVDGIDEAPHDQVSKYSWYLLNSPETGGRVQVVRNAVPGWGGEQCNTLLEATRAYASESKNALTAVVHSYGQTSNPSVRVGCHFKQSQITLEFPYVRREGKLEFVPTLDLQRSSVLMAMTEWAKQAVPKKFLGIF